MRMGASLLRMTMGASLLRMTMGASLLRMTMGAPLLGMTMGASLLGMTWNQALSLRPRAGRLVRRRALLQDTRRITLEALAQSGDVIGGGAEVAHHLIDASLLTERVAEISEQRVNLME